jgi:hypothetical protein
VFHRAHIGQGSEVRINGTVHLRTRLEPAQPYRLDGSRSGTRGNSAPGSA